MVGETEDYLGGLLGIEDETLVPARAAAGRDLAVEGPVDYHVQRPDVLIPLVERDTEFDDVLGVSKVVLDPAPPDPFYQGTLTRPPRVGAAIVVSSVFGKAAVRAAAVSGRPVVICGGFSHYRCPFASIGEGWDASQQAW